MEQFLAFLIQGMAFGLVFALVALGWVLIYKCSGVFNIAVGELTLIGGFVSLLFYTHLAEVMRVPIAFLLSVVGTIVVGLVLGLLMERIVLRRMTGNPILAVIMVTVGLSLFFKGVVFTIWDLDPHSFNPGVFDAVSGYGGLWSFLTALMFIIIVIYFIKYTRWGLSMRAFADDQTAASCLGITPKFVNSFTWAIAFMAAGVGGALIGATSGVDQSLSLLGLFTLPIVVIGGLASIPGAIIGGIIIGIAHSLANGYLGTHLFGIENLAPFAVMIAFLLVKPNGLWGDERIERI